MQSQHQSDIDPYNDTQELIQIGDFVFKPEFAHVLQNHPLLKQQLFSQSYLSADSIKCQSMKQALLTIDTVEPSQYIHLISATFVNQCMGFFPFQICHINFNCLQVLFLGGSRNQNPICDPIINIEPLSFMNLNQLQFLDIGSDFWSVEDSNKIRSFRSLIKTHLPQLKEVLYMGNSVTNFNGGRDLSRMKICSTQIQKMFNQHQGQRILTPNQQHMNEGFFQNESGYKFDQVTLRDQDLSNWAKIEPQQIKALYLASTNMFQKMKRIKQSTVQKSLMSKFEMIPPYD